MKVVWVFVLLNFLLLPATLFAGEADVIKVVVDKSGSTHSLARIVGKQRSQNV
ncbi:MAG: hypothetical protein U9Q61_11125 [Thermodesulfobacteriota bacterium]|nr:hypothetical protein [Thermodesulfobacteriota bacterium]